MKGFIQPYADTGSVRTNPPTAADPFSGNHVPLKAVDPLATLPPCAPANGSLGTYHFVIPRIKA